jgi:hypothetical protein
MSHNANANWIKSSVLLYLAVFINIAVVIAAYLADQNLFWMLAASVPLLSIAIYIGQLQNIFFWPVKGFSKQKFSLRLGHLFSKSKENDLSFMIGNEQCSKPYDAYFFNIETKKEQQSTHSRKPVKGNHNGYYLADGGRVWQICPDYTGCCTDDGNFNGEIFKEQARRSEIKMIELKLSYKTGSFHSANSEKNISDIAGNSKSIFYEGSAFNVFRNAEAMILFLKTLRDLSGGKPVGVRLAPDNKKDFYSICHAICKTQIAPDFIVVEGVSVDTDQTYLYQHPDHAKSLYEALLFVAETLRHYRIRGKIKIIASGNISSAFDILKLVSLGANGVWAIQHNDKAEAGMFYSGKRSMRSHKDLYSTTLLLMSSLKFKSVHDITLANFFSKLKIAQPETSGMQNNIAFFSDEVAEPEILKIRLFNANNKNEMNRVSNKVQKEMSF